MLMFIRMFLVVLNEIRQNKPKYLHYYNGKELVLGDKKQHNIIKTNKILKNDQFGTLPPNIENLFTIIDPKP